MITVSISIDPADAGNACLRFAANYLSVLKELNDQNASLDSGNSSDNSSDDEKGDSKYMPWIKQNGALQGKITFYKKIKVLKIV